VDELGVTDLLITIIQGNSDYYEVSTEPVGNGGRGRYGSTKRSRQTRVSRSNAQPAIYALFLSLKSVLTG
jgi:hypothetical protein